MASSSHDDAEDRPLDAEATAQEPDWRRDALKARLFGDDKAASRIGRFIVLGSLGSGGMGSVLRAYDETLDRQVAVKLMHPSARGKHDRRMLREAQALARLSHPNVVQVYEVGEVGEQLFIAMELISGRTLERWQSEHPSWRQCLEVYVQAGRGLVAAHAAGMIHRDFKPGNCILDDEGRVRVLDFGLARGSDLPEVEDDEPSADGTGESARLELPDDLIDRSSASGTSLLQEKLTRTGSVLGTVAYMAPEQLHGETDARADQFSFCVSLYEAIFGRRPFGQNPMKLLLKMAVGDAVAPLPPPPGRGVPRWLVRALERGLSAKPADRWPSMAALLDQIDQRYRRRPWRWAALGIGLAGIGFAGASLSTPAPSPCADAATRTAELWTDADRQRVRNALGSLDVAYADEAWASVEPQLGGYVAALESAYTEACTATKIRNELTRNDLTRRNACLNERASALRQTVSVLARADRQVVERAVELVVALPELDPCEDVDALRRASELDPVDDAAAQSIERLREQAQQARALERAHKIPEGLEAIEAVIRSAQDLEHTGLLAEARLIEGSLLAERGDSEDAAESLRRSLDAALEHDLDAIAVDALSQLIYVVGVDLASADAGTWLGAVADGLVERVEQRGRTKARVSTAVGQVMSERGEYEQAQARIEEAIGQLEQLVGADHLALAQPLDSLAVVLRNQQRYEDALRYSQRSFDIRSHWQGRRHPQTAHQHTNLGMVLISLGRHPEARDHCREALEIFEGDKTPRHVGIAHAHSCLGTSMLTEALAATPSDPDPASGVNMVALEPAIEQFQRAADAWERNDGPKHPRVAKARGNLAVVLHRAKRYAEAVEQLERALAAMEGSEPTPANETLIANIKEDLAKTRKAADKAADKAQDRQEQ